VAFVEIYQDCNVFNHHAFEYATDKDTKEDHILRLEHGKPLIFGKNRDKGIRMNGAKLERVDLNVGGIKEDDLLFQDENDKSLAFALSRLRVPEWPEPMGVFYASPDETYEELLQAQVDTAIKQRGEGTIEKLLNMGETYTVDPGSAAAATNDSLQSY
jgi:2-oxoglutarate/2-oxoacid ferredoxin oxidoreductase subunit beta